MLLAISIGQCLAYNKHIIGIFYYYHFYPHLISKNYETSME